MKETSSPITKQLVLLINQSIYDGIVPEEVKNAKVCPIYKMD